MLKNATKKAVPYGAAFSNANKDLSFLLRKTPIL